MAGQDFTITQLKYDGNAAKYVVDREGLKLTWNVSNRAIPKQPWEYGLDVRTVLENYPGAAFDPVEQILGPNWEPFTLEGMLDDRWGGAGFADEQRRGLETIASACAPVRVSFEALTFDGIVKNLKIKYLNSFRIGYSFTISPHFREDQVRDLYPATKAKPASDYSALILQIVAELLEGHDRCPVSYVPGTLHDDVDAIVQDVAARADAIADVVEGRVFVVSPSVIPGAEQAINSVLKVAADLEGLRAVCLTLRDELQTVTTATGLFYEETLLNLEFDGWAKELCAQARFIAVQAREGAIEMRRRALPDAQAIYHPRAGESLYDVANRFFGSPDAWRKIADRNSLFQLEFDGTEMLVIPTKS